MRELLRTNDPTVIAFSTALLRGEDIDCFVLDVHMSVLEGSIGLLPRRLMVADRDSLPRPRGAARQRRPRRLELRMSFGRGGSHLRRLPRRPHPALAAPRAATAPPPTRSCSRPSSPPAPASACSSSAAAPAPPRSASPPGSRLSTCTGSSSSPPTPSLARRNAAENRPLAQRPRGRPAPAAGRRCAASASTTCSPTRRSTPPPTPPPPIRAATAPTARRTRPLADWIAAGLRRLAPGGRLVIIHRTARLAEILARALRPRRRDRGPAGRVASRPAGGAPARPRPQGPRRAANALDALTFHEGRGQASDEGALYCRGAEGAARHGGTVARCTPGWYRHATT